MSIGKVGYIEDRKGRLFRRQSCLFGRLFRGHPVFVASSSLLIRILCSVFCRGDPQTNVHFKVHVAGDPQNTVRFNVYLRVILKI